MGRTSTAPTADRRRAEPDGDTDALNWIHDRIRATQARILALTGADDVDWPRVQAAKRTLRALRRSKRVADERRARRNADRIAADTPF